MTKFSLPPIIGHRGACGYAPENTLASFEKAKALGCTMIEFDVKVNADGIPFIFHDDQLKRTSKGRGKFAKASAAYIQTLDAGSWFSRKFQGERIPTFEEALKWCVASNITPNVEIKPCPKKTKETAIATLNYINQFWPMDKALPLVSSFDIEALLLCRSLSPELPLGVLFHKWNRKWQNIASDLSAYSVHLNREIATKARIKQIKAAGYKVCVYTLNRKWSARRFLRWGVDSLFSDYPDRLQ